MRIAREPSNRPESASNYDAPGDEPLSLPKVELQIPLRIDAALAERLIQREVNPKEAFTVRDNTGAFFRASVKELDTNGGVALPYERLERSPEPSIEITLACSVLARQRMIFVVQKATELGVMRIVPLITDFSVKPDGLEHEKAHAWPGQVIRAAKQCRRSSLPSLLPPTSLDSFLASQTVSKADLCVFLDDRSEPTAAKAANPHKIVLIVGPEGGFTDTERKRLRATASPLVLGGRVLRAETAVLAGLTAVHMKWGDFK